MGLQRQNRGTGGPPANKSPAGNSIVIFGAGYLGFRIVQEARARNMRVTALTRNHRDAAALGGDGVRALTVPIHDRDWHEKVEPGVHYAVLCAGPGGGETARYRESCLEAMRSILAWAKGGRIGNLVFTSSTSVYAQDAGERVTEEDPADGATPGAKVLIETERVLADSKIAGRSFVLRLGGLYGPGRHRLLDRVRCRDFSLSSEEKPSVLNLVRVEDACAGVFAALTAPDSVRGGLFNLVDDCPSPRREVIAWLRDEVRKRGLEIEEPGRPHPRRSTRGKNRVISNQRARKLLGWVPAYPDFRAGFADLFGRLMKE